MSADNGIYIGGFPKNGTFEYRVGYAAAIENTMEGPQEIQEAYITLVFANKLTFATYDEAFKFASILAFKMKTEYGICYVEYEIPFPTLTEQEARKIIFGG